MKIEVDYVQLEKQYQELCKLIENYNRKFKVLTDNLKTYSAWTGKDSQKFQERVAVMESILNRSMKNVNSITSNVHTAAEGYRNAAENVGPHASRI